MIERKYTIPLRKQFLKAQRYKRSYKSIKAVKEFLMKHMKVDDVRICKELNESILRHGRKNPPSKVEVKVVKVEEKGIKPYARVNLVDAPLEIKEEKKGKSLGEKLKEKIVAKPDKGESAKAEIEKEKHDVLKHAKVEHKADIKPEGHVIKEKRSPKAAKIIGETGKK